MATRRRQVEDDGMNKEGNELARGWRENSKLQQLAHSSTPLQFRARREFQCGLHAKPYSSSCKLPVRANHICFLPVHLSLSILCLSATISRQQFVSSLISLSFLFPFISFFLFLFIFNEHRNLRDWDRTNLSRLSISFEMFDLLETKLYRRSLPSAHRPDETAARNVI